MNIRNINMDAIVKSFVDNKPSIRPVFMITYGPPASGKSSALNLVCEDLGVDPKSVVGVLIDDVVERTPGYLETSREVWDRYQDKDDPQLTKELGDVYFDYRKTFGILGETVLNTAIARRNNIAWETTGANIDWTVKTINEAKLQGYLVVLIYPFVFLDDLKKRAVLRSNREHPRRPPESFINMSFENAQNNFKKVLNKVDSAYVYDNTVSGGKMRPMVSVVKEYRGWEEKTDKMYKSGVAWKNTCVNESLSRTNVQFTPKFRDVINNLCGTNFKAPTKVGRLKGGRRRL